MSLEYAFSSERNRLDLCAPGSVESEGDFLKSAVLSSLFTNRRDPAQNLGGCWSDGLYHDSFGSLLWTRQREKITTTLLNDLENICLAALAWIKREGRVQEISVAVTRAAAHAVDITVTLTLNSGERQTQVEVYELQEAA